MMDHLQQHLEESIGQTKEAIERESRLAIQIAEYVSEFAESDPETADIYRYWQKFHSDRLVGFQADLLEYQARLTKRIGQPA